MLIKCKFHIDWSLSVYRYYWVTHTEYLLLLHIIIAFIIIVVVSVSVSITISISINFAVHYIGFL